VTEETAGVLILIDPSSGVPVYRQLMEQIKLLVASGVLRSGEPLPSTRALSAELGINPMTISKAYSFLEKEGVVERRPGLPLVVRAVGGEELQERKIEQLRGSLASVVAVVQQLGLSRDRALEIFRRMLDERSRDKSTEVQE